MSGADCLLAEELADELRGAIEALSARAVEGEDLAAALGLVRALRERLRGAPRPHWYEAEEPIDALGPASGGAYADQSAVRGRFNPLAPPLEIRVVESQDGARQVEGRATLGLAYEGPPHGVHGGWVAALFDELLGATQGLAGAPGVTGWLRVRFRHVTPLGEELRLRGWIEREEGRRLITRATCHAGATLTAEAEALFVRVDFAEVRDRMRERAAGGG